MLIARVLMIFEGERERDTFVELADIGYMRKHADNSLPIASDQDRASIAMQRLLVSSALGTTLIVAIEMDQGLQLLTTGGTDAQSLRFRNRFGYLILAWCVWRIW